MDKKKEKVIILSSIFLILILGTFYNAYIDNDINSNLGITKGKVIDYSFSNNKYIVKFEYIIAGIKYQGQESTIFFKCDNGVPGCKEQNFIVKYSTKNPNNCEIDLGKYNRKKLTRPTF